MFLKSNKSFIHFKKNLTKLAFETHKFDLRIGDKI